MMFGELCRGCGSDRGHERQAEEAVPHTAEAAAKQEGQSAGSGRREAERGLIHPSATPFCFSCSGVW